MFSKKLIILSLFLIITTLICIGTASASAHHLNQIKIEYCENGSIVLVPYTNCTDPECMAHHQPRTYGESIKDPNKKSCRFIDYNSPLPLYTVGSEKTDLLHINKEQLKDFSISNESVGKVESKVVNINVSAPVVKNKFKKSAFFKMNLKDSKNKVLKNVKLNVKVFTGKKYKNFTVKTNSKGVAKLNTKSLKKGVHKVIINSLNKKYNINKKGNLIIIK